MLPSAAFLGYRLRRVRRPARYSRCKAFDPATDTRGAVHFINFVDKCELTGIASCIKRQRLLRERVNPARTGEPRRGLYGVRAQPLLLALEFR
jgi:hypothetical protein